MADGLPTRRPSGGRSLIRRLLPPALVFAVVLAALAVFHPRLREALGTTPSPGPAVVTRELAAAGVVVVEGCDLPRDRDAEVRRTLWRLARCLDDAWTATLRRVNRVYEPPADVNLVTSRAEASCGTEDSDWAGIYCPGNRTINVLVEQDWAFTAMFTLAHEYAHHVQEIVGISSAGREDEAWSRRLELQADCLAAVMLREVDPGGLAVMRNAGEEDEERAVPERRTHGSARNSAEWIARGQREGTVAACDTWSASESEVS